MAYTVGSASVDIVPDFRRAQIEITKFFNSQQNELRIPAKVDLDTKDTSRIEKQAEQVGERVSKAMAAGAAKNQASADRLAMQMSEAAERSKVRAHAEALKMNAELDKAYQRDHAEALRLDAAMEREAAKATRALISEEAKARADADKLAEQMAEGRMRSIREAHAEAVRLNAQFDRDRAAQIRADELSGKAAIRTAEIIATERLRIQREALQAGQREEERVRREEEKFAVRSGRAVMKAVEKAMADEAKNSKVKVEIDRKQAVEAGREQGGLVTRAVREEVHQNAGLIAAVIAAALIAGAPVATAAAVTLFAGIGAAGAFQSQQLRATWVGLWDEIKTNAVADSAVLVPVFSRMAGQIGQSFEKMRPLLRDAFTAVGPQIDVLTESTLRMAQFALPGLVRAVQAGMPVVSGFGDLFEKIGIGLSEFFDRISAHSPASGQALSSLGDIMGELLPTLGELLGEGAELAAVVLPAVTSAMTGLNVIVSALGSNLPIIASGFLAFRAAQGVGRFISNLADSMQSASEKGGMFAAGQGKIAGTLSKVAEATPVVGAAVAVVGIIMARSSEQANDWANALLAGGEAAATARKQMNDWGLASREANSGLGGFVAGLVGFNATTYNTASAIEEGNDQFKEMLAAMSPLETAQHNLQTATKALADGMDDEGTSASELAKLKADVANAAAAQAREEEKLQRATEGVTDAMLAQADAARARVDSNFAYQQSVLDTAQAQQDLKDAMTGTYDTEAEKIAAVEQATLDLNKAYADQVAAAGEIAKSNLPATMTDNQKAILGAKAELQELNNLMAQGVVLPPSLEAYRQQLIAITGGANAAALEQATLVQALEGIGVAVEAIPDSAAIKIEAPTDEVRTRLEDLGLTVTELPDGSIRVEAKTEEAKAELGGIATDLTGLNATTAEPTVDANTNPFAGEVAKATGQIVALNGQRPTPVVDANAIPFQSAMNNTMAGIRTLNAQRPTPVIGAVDAASGTIAAIQRGLAAIQSKTVTVTVRAVEVQNTKALVEHAGGATGGAVEDLRMHHKYDIGGAVVGIGSAIEDRISAIGPDPFARYSIANGEHILDGRDVALMGGQAGVYAFREMLNSGRLGRPKADTGVQRMVSIGAPRTPSAPPTSTRDVTILTSDNPRAIIRAMKAEEQQAAALAPVWS